MRKFECSYSRELSKRTNDKPEQHLDVTLGSVLNDPVDLVAANQHVGDHLVEIPSCALCHERQLNVGYRA